MGSLAPCNIIQNSEIPGNFFIEEYQENNSDISFLKSFLIKLNSYLTNIFCFNLYILDNFFIES